MKRINLSCEIHSPVSDKTVEIKKGGVSSSQMIHGKKKGCLPPVGLQFSLCTTELLVQTARKRLVKDPF